MRYVLAAALCLWPIVLGAAAYNFGSEDKRSGYAWDRNDREFFRIAFVVTWLIQAALTACMVIQ
jgi:hypothetical protein